MRFLSFCIKNFRNLRLAECSDIPDFMVICGGNGCGKSALLEALMTAKEYAGSYGNFKFDSRAVSADSRKATITMTLSFAENERRFVKEKFGSECPEADEVIIEIDKHGGARALKRSGATHQLLGYYSRALGSPGFFDYIGTYRQTQKSRLQTWDASYLSDDRAKQTLARDEQKFQLTKNYLVALKMGDLQELQTALLSGNPASRDSLKEIREFFNFFFAPMKFNDVFINKSPFEFAISTPVGDIDIDDLSSGEKEILNIFIRFHQLKPKGAVILFDEADAHLHPDLERRYLEVLRQLGAGNQLFLTTHSPEMMIAAGTDSLYTTLKEPPANGGNQLVRVTHSQDLHKVLSGLMGSRGIVSFNQRIVFIEGEDTSADRDVYEAAYPPSKYNVSFVPAGNSATVRRIAEQVNTLLTASIGFQQYFSIVDGDIERFESDPTEGSRLFRLPVYHVENLLINENEILEVTRSMMGSKCPYNTANEVGKDLQKLVLSDAHLKPYTRSLLDARLAKLARDAHDAVYKQKNALWQQPKIPEYSEIEEEAKRVLESALANDTWRSKCKGRDLLKTYCNQHGLKYEHFRNLLISRMETPPKALADIMNHILVS
jgi:predicted ATPase